MRGSLYARSGKIFAEYRLADEGIQDLTGIVGDIIGMKNHFRIEDLGPGASGTAALGEVNGRIPLAVVGYEADILGDLQY